MVVTRQQSSLLRNQNQQPTTNASATASTKAKAAKRQPSARSRKHRQKPTTRTNLTETAETITVKPPSSLRINNQVQQPERNNQVQQPETNNQVGQPETNTNTSRDRNTGTLNDFNPFSLQVLQRMDLSNQTLINVLYSDGQAEIPSATGPGMTPNRPPADMIKHPDEDVKDTMVYYKPCKPNSNTHTFWRIELGTQLFAQMEPEKFNASPSLYCLQALPEGYALLDLYSHSKAGDKPTIRTYLFGHPNGPNDQYESPQEFLAHLMWLAADRYHKKENCGCVICKGSGQLDKRPPTPPPQVASGAEAALEPPLSRRDAAVTAMAALQLLQQQQVPERETVTKAIPSATSTPTPQ
ncbi:hypothetical protein L211DRAFT_851717 [Terfezia boudieri ATCC MYA-4762]|uniref:Cryptic loci regulator 2 N-terminal domain-containing protein n=1 Tax=Terfezia boudieri ATCC MYA-4762 TaxID=1051890 RepID=A0A3N4LI34_9PEZI|nr:hypothetical protein L211DRAFT_851717 [Terfezia boudieri ATCC MYA-4762]